MDKGLAKIMSCFFHAELCLKTQGGEPERKTSEVNLRPFLVLISTCMLTPVRIPIWTCAYSTQRHIHAHMCACSMPMCMYIYPSKHAHIPHIETCVWKREPRKNNLHSCNPKRQNELLCSNVESIYEWIPYRNPPLCPLSVLPKDLQTLFLQIRDSMAMHTPATCTGSNGSFPVLFWNKNQAVSLQKGMLSHRLPF